MIFSCDVLGWHRWSRWSDPAMREIKTLNYVRHFDGTLTETLPTVRKVALQARQCGACGAYQEREAT